MVEVEFVEARIHSRPASRLTRGLLLVAEVFLILVIVALLVAIWMPAWIGPHPGVTPR